MHLTALVDDLDHVCCRYRVTAFRPWFEKAGHRLDVRPWPRSAWGWLRLGSTLSSSDVVILQRKLLARWKRFLLRRAAKRLVYDFDDALFLRDSYAVKGVHSRQRLARFTATVRAADGVVAGNDYLAEHARRLSGGVPTTLIPTCVEPSRYFRAKHRAGRPVQLVWVGTSVTLRGLEAIRPLLEQVGRALPGIALKLLCDRFFDLQHMPVLMCPWEEVHEAAELAAADVGISWLPADPWSQGKCGLKVLQYMAAGLPVVANPVGVQAELVRHGESGFLATTPAEWVEAIGRLAGDPALRRRMGDAGRRRVEQEFSVECGARRWLALLDGFARREGEAPAEPVAAEARREPRPPSSEVDAQHRGAA